MSYNTPSDVVLKHYGVKGMKWGVRKDRDRNPVEVSSSQTPGKYVRTSGGQNQTASEDAVRARKAAQKAKASTTDALSNKELQSLVQRMNLEQQYASLKEKEDRRSSGAKLANVLLGSNLASKGIKKAGGSVAGKKGEVVGEFLRTFAQSKTSGPKKKKK